MDTLEAITSWSRINVSMPMEVISERIRTEHEPFVERPTQWNTIEVLQKKQIRSDFYSRAKAHAVVSEELQTVEIPESVECTKLNKTYAFITLDA